MTETTSHNPEKGQSPAQPKINLLWISGEVGVIIAVPLVILILIGLKIDRYFDTMPWFTIAALLIAPFVSGAVIWHKIKGI